MRGCIYAISQIFCVRLKMESSSQVRPGTRRRKIRRQRGPNVGQRRPDGSRRRRENGAGSGPDGDDGSGAAGRPAAAGEDALQGWRCALRKLRGECRRRRLQTLRMPCRLRGVLEEVEEMHPLQSGHRRQGESRRRSFDDGRGGSWRPV